MKCRAHASCPAGSTVVAVVKKGVYIYIYIYACNTSDSYAPLSRDQAATVSNSGTVSITRLHLLKHSCGTCSCWWRCKVQRSLRSLFLPVISGTVDLLIAIVLLLDY